MKLVNYYKNDLKITVDEDVAGSVERVTAAGFVSEDTYFKIIETKSKEQSNTVTVQKVVDFDKVQRELELKYASFTRAELIEEAESLGMTLKPNLNKLMIAREIVNNRIYKMKEE